MHLAQLVKSFFREDFHPLTYGLVAAFLALAAGINYYFSFDDTYLEPLAGTWQGMAGYVVLYGFGWFAVCLPLLWFSPDRNLLYNHNFWIRSLFFLTLLGVDGGMSGILEWLGRYGLDVPEYWIQRTVKQVESVLLWIPVFYVFMKWNEPAIRDGIYGLRWQAEDLKPFLSMLWIMVPLIGAASFLPDFQQQYPKFNRILPFLPETPIGHWCGLIAYEISYLLSFVSTELFFRGALVIGMSSLLGRRAILPMVSTYMFLHFGKPMGEAISSVFGGYILGVLALRNRNIWGGIFIHTCVAFLMDMAAALQHLFHKTL